MGKKRGKRKNQTNEQAPTTQKKARTDSWDLVAERTNEIYEYYYKNQSFLTEEEYPIFLKAMQSYLPASIRISSSHPKRGLVAKEFEKAVSEISLQNVELSETFTSPQINANEKFIENSNTNTLASESDQEMNVEVNATSVEGNASELNLKDTYQLDDQNDQTFHMPKPISWYPEEPELKIPMAWSFNFPKHYLKKFEPLARTNAFIQEHTERGSLSRQEEVSMIPPLLLDVRPGHSVLDMCAAPGSKTCQILEMLNVGDDPGNGFVIANDVDHARTDTLSHQLQRWPTINFIVTNHQAQAIPNIYLNDTLLQFDRILCDVPCTGDGTLRKNIDLWAKWNPMMALGINPVQLSIASRAIELLKSGGRMVYSTCSMNPVEDEAVVAALLKKYEGRLELVDVGNELPHLRRSNGIHTWRVMDREKNWYSTQDEVPMALRDKFPKSCFPPETGTDGLHLERCLRLLPHLQDTGGFFVAIFQKLHVENEDIRTRKPDTNFKTKQRGNTMPLDTLSGDALRRWKSSKLFWGIQDTFIDDGLVARQTAKDKPKNLFYMSTICKDIVVQNRNLKVVNGGFKCFYSSTGGTDGGVDYRILPESLNLILPHMNEKRILAISETDLTPLVAEADPLFNAFSSEFQSQIEKLDRGYCFFSVHLTGKQDRKYYLGFKGFTSCRVLMNLNERQYLLRKLKIDPSKAPVLHSDSAKNETDLKTTNETNS